MAKNNLTACFGAVSNDNGVCALIISPHSENHNGDRLEALLRGLSEEYVVIRVVIDDMTSHNDKERARVTADDWLEKNLETLVRHGVEIRNMKNWSAILEDEDEYYGQKYRDFSEECDRNRTVRMLMNKWALRQAADEDSIADDLSCVAEQREKLVGRLAGLSEFRAVAVICDWELPDDRRLFEREKNMQLCPNSLEIPEFVKVTFVEQKNEPDPAPVFEEPKSKGADILPFKPLSP